MCRRVNGENLTRLLLTTILRPVRSVAESSRRLHQAIQNENVVGPTRAPHFECTCQWFISPPQTPPSTIASSREAFDDPEHRYGGSRARAPHTVQAEEAASEVVRRFNDDGHDRALPVLVEVLKAEADERGQRRTDRLPKVSRLAPGKTMETLDRTRVPRPVALRLDELASGAFLDNAQNVPCFGLPGRGKTHAAAALGHALVQRGHAVRFTPKFRSFSPRSATSSCLARSRSSRAPTRLKCSSR